MTTARPDQDDARPGLLAQLAAGPVICAEGFLFELERRGYLAAGEFVPEVALDHPEALEALHRDYQRAGSDIVEAFTYNGHREKMRVIGKESLLEPLNRAALRLARKVADDRPGNLMAGNISNTNIWHPEDRSAQAEVRSMFDEMVGWAVEEGAEMIIGETFYYAGEAFEALDAIKASGLPAVVTIAPMAENRMMDGVGIVETCQELEARGADVVGMNCFRGPATMLPWLEEIRKAVSCQVAALPVPYRTTEQEPTFFNLSDRGLPLPFAAWQALPDRARSALLQSVRDRRLCEGGLRAGHPLSRRLLRRVAHAHPRGRRSGRSDHRRESVFGKDGESLPVRHQRTDRGTHPGARRPGMKRAPVPARADRLPD